MESKSMWDRLTEATSVGFAWSVLIHTALLIAMAMIVFPLESNDGAIAIFATEADDEVTTFDDVADLEFDAGGATESTEQAVELVPVQSDIPLPVATVVQPVTAAKSVGEGSGESTGDGKGARRMRAPANAVRRGRFAAWTVPIRQYASEKPKEGDSPRPGQDYYIVIQLQLPESMKTYGVGDLKGSVVGTDGYRLQIPNNTYYYIDETTLQQATKRHRLPIVDHKVQILVRVPGAKYATVRDRISIASSRLAESQTLELVFKLSDQERRRPRF